jgi:tetratricopeptide (TPR) repeat protein
MQSDKASEVEKIARERIAKNPGDEQAYHYLVIATVNEKAKRAEVIKMLEGCVERNAKAAVCHHGLGAMMGSNALDVGVMNALSSAGKIKDSFLKAVEHAPDFYDARRDAIQYYLQAPGIVGGSVSKAKDLAKAAPNPEHVKMFNAIIANYEKKPADAEKLLASVKLQAGDDQEGELAQLWTSTGYTYVSAKQPEKAKPIAERVIKLRPDRPGSHYNYANLLLANKDFDGALAAVNKAASLDTYKTFAIDWVLGRIHEAKGDKAAAKTAYERVLKWPKASDRLKKAVNERLAEIG